MMELTRKPTRRNTAASITAALGTLVVIGSGSPAGGLFGLVGLGLLALGLHRGVRLGVDLGGGILFISVVLGGLQGLSPEASVIGAVGTLLAWDLANSAVELGEQLGRETVTGRLEAAHIVTSLAVGLLSATVGYGVFVFSGAGYSLGVVVLLILAVVFLIAGLRSSRPEAA
ncbi:hypothetical protein ACLI4R_05480 [Natrialbaceae archaeon A-chndr2]